MCLTIFLCTQSGYRLTLHPTFSTQSVNTSLSQQTFAIRNQVALYPCSVKTNRVLETIRHQERENTFKNKSRSNYTRCFEEEEFIIAQNGSPSAAGPVCISHLFVSGLVCLDTVSSACSEFDRSPAFLRSRRRVS